MACLMPYVKDGFGDCIYMTYDFIVPCLMGTEGLVADELKFAGF